MKFSMPAKHGDLMQVPWLKDCREEGVSAGSWLRFSSSDTHTQSRALLILQGDYRSAVPGLHICRLWNQTDKDLNSYLAPTHCVTWGKSLNLSGIPFPHVSIQSSPIWLPWGSSKICSCSACCSAWCVVKAVIVILGIKIPWPPHKKLQTLAVGMRKIKRFTF